MQPVLIFFNHFKPSGVWDWKTPQPGEREGETKRKQGGKLSSLLAHIRGNYYF